MYLYNIILTGIPRSGTTLACYLLNKVPNVIALHEPLKTAGELTRLESNNLVCDTIMNSFTKTRKQILIHKTAISKNRHGRLIDNPFSNNPDKSGLRQKEVSRGEIVIDKKLSNNFFLIIKHTASFVALLPFLSKKFPCYAIIRNPLSILGSWNSIQFESLGGRSLTAEYFNPSLKSNLESIPDYRERQLYLIDWFFKQCQENLPTKNILRYEEIITSSGSNLARIVPQAQKLAEPLENKNLNSLYNRNVMYFLGNKLLNNNHASFWSFYTKDEVKALMARL